MKHKFLTKIAAVTLGLAMAVGVSVGVANNRNAKPVYATDYTYSFSITTDDFNTTSYDANNNEKHTTAVCTSDANLTMEVYWTSNQVMKNGSDMQWQKNKGYIYNSTDLGTIESVTVNSSAGSFTTRYGTSEQPSSGSAGTGKGFFKTSVGNATGKSTSVVVTFTITEGAGYTLSYDANGGTGTMTDDNSPYEENASVTVLDNTFTREGYEFVNFNTAANGSGQDYDEGDTFNINSNTTLFAQWSVIRYPCTDENNQITWDLSVASYDTMTSEEATWTSGKATISVAKGTSTTNVNNIIPPEESHTRFYQNSIMTISPADGYKINSIVFTATNSSYASIFNNNTWTNATSSVDSTDVTVVPSVKTEDLSVTFAAATRLTQIVINYASSSPLASIAVSGTYQTSFDQYDEFNHDGMIVTATYEDASTENVTASATWSEPDMSTTGNKIVTVSYTEGITKTTTYTINVTATPYIVPNETSASGQVGENDVLTFDYDNLIVGLNIVSSATSIVTVGEPECFGTEGMVQINFVGSGTANVLFKDGDTQLASVPVTVTRETSVAVGTLFTANMTSGTSVTSGFTITSENTVDKTGFYQDSGTADSSVCSFMVKKDSALFSFAPAKIQLVARLGSSSTKDLDNNVEAFFVDEDDNEIDGTRVTVVTHLPKDPENFTVSIPYSSAARGLKITHLKETSWNVRYYSFKLVYDYGSSVKTITATEVKDGNGTTTSVESVKLRFGAQLSSDNWTAFNSEHTIEDYGVMFARKTVLDANSLSSVKAAFESRQSSLLIVRKGSGTAPSLSGSNRVFTAYLTIDSSDYNTVFCATPFILAGGQYYFLDEMRYSVKTLAAECQTTHGSPLSDEALTILNA